MPTSPLGSSKESRVENRCRLYSLGPKAPICFCGRFEHGVQDGGCDSLAVGEDADGVAGSLYSLDWAWEHGIALKGNYLIGRGPLGGRNRLRGERVTGEGRLQGGWGCYTADEFLPGPGDGHVEEARLAGFVQPHEKTPDALDRMAFTRCHQFLAPFCQGLSLFQKVGMSFPGHWVSD